MKLKNLFDEKSIKRIAGNAGVAFFTTLAGLSIADVPQEEKFFAAFFVAFINGGLAAFQEIQREGNDNGNGKTAPAGGKMVLLF